jgi:hypothetical protein
LAFGSGFGLFDSFLEFLFEDSLEKLLSFGAKKVIEVVECATVFGDIHNLFAFGEEGIEAFHEQIADAGREAGHKILPCKSAKRNSIPKLPLIFDTPLVR